MRLDNVSFPEYNEEIFKRLTDLTTTYINLKFDFDKTEAELDRLRNTISKVINSRLEAEHKIKRIGKVLEDGKAR